MALGRAAARGFGGRVAALATMHGKDRAIAGPLLAAGLRVEVARGIDTDAFGTFTGEIARAGTMREAAIAKARAGMRALGHDIGVASEGSYGPHPAFPFAAIGAELIVLVDDRLGLTIAEELADERPVYDHAVSADSGSIQGFLDRVGFPAQGLIVRPNAGGGAAVKGIRDAGDLAAAVAGAARASADGMALVQTDMRAHMNPRRMEVIGRLAEKLAARLAVPCPACGLPGFGMVRTERGLPCEACGTPTAMVRQEIWACAACGHAEPRPRRDGLTAADPAGCPLCNP
jgi:ribosomal protein L37E